MPDTQQCQSGQELQHLIPNVSRYSTTPLAGCMQSHSLLILGLDIAMSLLHAHAHPHAKQDGIGKDFVLIAVVWTLIVICFWLFVEAACIVSLSGVH